jgi:hypothetical protein
MPKSRAQFTPMRTKAADSRTKIVITLEANVPQETRREPTACRTKDLVYLWLIYLSEHVIIRINYFLRPSATKSKVAVQPLIVF